MKKLLLMIFLLTTPLTVNAQSYYDIDSGISSYQSGNNIYTPTQPNLQGGWIQESTVQVIPAFTPPAGYTPQPSYGYNPIRLNPGSPRYGR